MHVASEREKSLLLLLLWLDLQPVIYVHAL